MKWKLIALLATLSIVFAFAVGTTVALNPHNAPPAGSGGLPNKDCADYANSPGNTNSQTVSPGSPFGETAGAGEHYAADGANDNPSSINSQAPNTPNSQYDVACFQVSKGVTI